MPGTKEKHFSIVLKLALLVETLNILTFMFLAVFKIWLDLWKQRKSGFFDLICGNSQLLFSS